MQPALPPDAQADLDTAKTLALVALILEILFLAIGVAVAAFFLSAFAQMPQTSTPGTPPMATSFFVAVAALAGVLGLIWVLLTYFLIYARLRRGEVEPALTPTLVIGILTLIFGNVISGILLIIAYVKAKDAHTKMLFGPRAPV